MEIKIIPVVNAVIVKDNKILLGRRSSNKKYFPDYWTIPGGKVNPGEKLLDSVKREVKEETGLIVKKIYLKRITEDFHDDHHHIIFDFIIDVIGEPKISEELPEFSWFRKEDISNLKMLDKDKDFLISLDLSRKDDVTLEI